MLIPLDISYTPMKWFHYMPESKPHTGSNRNEWVTNPHTGSNRSVQEIRKGIRICIHQGGWRIHTDTRGCHRIRPHRHTTFHLDPSDNLVDRNIWSFLEHSGRSQQAGTATPSQHTHRCLLKQSAETILYCNNNIQNRTTHYNAHSPNTTIHSIHSVIHYRDITEALPTLARTNNATYHNTTIHNTMQHDNLINFNYYSSLNIMPVSHLSTI